MSETAMPVGRDAPRGVLVTRPEPGAAETAAKIAALGWDPVLAPALVLRPLPFAAPSRAQALLLPSRAAARALAPWPVPVFAVGEATAEEARRRGFARVTAATGDAAALTALVARSLRPQDGPLLLAVGRGYSLDLAQRLRARGFAVIRRVVYGAEPAPALPEAAASPLREGRVRLALFFSPRSASCSMVQVRDAGLLPALAGVEALAISPRVAATLSGLCAWRNIRAAPRPDQDSLLEMLGTP
ncbi:MAG: uroporphyrinogen-III synthase [Acetobacteraceae bacterium]|nr:uroporphyrinogen-III synthase [Acetobacteraceae bacterium]